MKKTEYNSGQSILEYIIIITIVAVAVLAVLSLFGDKVRMLFAGTVNTIADEDTVHASVARDQQETESKRILELIDERGKTYWDKGGE